MIKTMISAIERRRSVRYFEPGISPPDETVRRLIELATYAPSAFNLQHWRFVIVKDSASREKLSLAAFGQRQVREAGSIIILCSDLKAWNKNPEQCWAHTPTYVRQKMVENINNSYSPDKREERDEAMRSGGLVAMTLMLAAQEMGYDSCPMTGFNFNEVSNIIKLPDDHVICMMLALGKAAAEPLPRGGRRKIDDIVFYDRFSIDSDSRDADDQYAVREANFN
jgi:nitroreductase